MPAGSDIAAAIFGGLSGATEGYSWLEEMKRKQQEQDARIADQQARRQMEEMRLNMQQEQVVGAELRQHDAEQQRRRTQTSEMLQTRGPGAPLSPEERAQVQDVGLGYRLEDVPLARPAAMSTPNRESLAPVPLGLKTETTSRIRPTYEQLEASAEKKRAADERRQLDAYIETQPAHVRQALRAGVLTGKLPTLDPGDFIPPEDQQQQEIARRQAVDEALRPGRLKEAEQRAQIQARYRPSAGEKAKAPTADERSLPSGVRSYLQKIRAKHTANPMQALEELDAHVNEQLAKHPGIDPDKARDYLMSLFPARTFEDVETPVDPSDPLGAQRRELQARPAPPPVGATPARRAAGGGAPAGRGRVQAGAIVTLRNGKRARVVGVRPDGKLVLSALEE